MLLLFKFLPWVIGSQLCWAIAALVGWHRVFLLPWSHDGAGGWLCVLLGSGRAPLCPQAAVTRFGSQGEQLPTPCQTFLFLLHMVWLDCNPQRWGRTEKTFRACGKGPYGCLITPISPWGLHWGSVCSPEGDKRGISLSCPTFQGVGCLRSPFSPDMGFGDRFP